jgi:DNA mismatch repair protein MutS
MSLINEYFELTKRYQDEYGEKTILLMQVGAFFEVYGINNKELNKITSSKISDFSQICELNIVDKNTCVGKNNVMMAGFKDIMIEKYLRKIQDAGFTAVVYTQDENIKNTTRSLAGVFSPGTYFHTDSPSLTNSITCVWVNLIENKIFMKGKYIIVGVANIDIFTGKTSIFQFKEIYINSPTTYDKLERFISIYNPSEVILISDLPDEKEINNIISYAGISASLIHKLHICKEETKSNDKIERLKNCEKQSYQKEILSKFYKFDNFDIFIQNFNENNIATQAFCYLLDFVYQHNPQLVNKISEPIFENCFTRLSLANHTLKQLNIIDDGNVKTNKYSCVSSMLNNCCTPMGRRKFLYNILNPIYDETILQREYDITEYYLNDLEKYKNLFKNRLLQIKDLSKFERQIYLKKISPKSFFTLYNNITIIKEISQIINEDSNKKIFEYLLNFEPNLLEIHNICSQLLKLIEQNINIELAKELDQLQQFEVNFIQIGVDNELDKKTQILNESELKLESIRECLSNLIENKEKKTSRNGDYVKIHETEKNNYGLVCTNRRCKLLEDFLPKNEQVIELVIKPNNSILKFNFIISKNKFEYEKQNSTNNFITDSQISSLCKNISSTKICMKDLITLAYNKFTEEFGNFQKQLEQIINFITLIDVLHNKSEIAHKFNYCKPTIIQSEKACVNAIGIRHSLIEQFQLNELYIKNDISLGDGVTDGILLYGTNAVGKTTLIRALGIAVIMAQAGLYVPSSEFKFKPYRYIFTRIIGNDNIFKGLSTFEVEMSELRTILRLMDENSLVLGDELCSGTETMSAISIFVAGIQKLCISKSSFIFATHLHEIVNFDEISNLKNVCLKHMEVIYDKEKDILIYDRKLKNGSGNNLYGLEVCKSLNLPQDFLDAANEIRIKYSPESKSILSLKQSRYNSNKIVGMCENCGKNMGTEVHHLYFQSEANDNGIIVNDLSVFHKNNLANLMTLCENCHDKIHKTNTKQKKVKTSKGQKLTKI